MSANRTFLLMGSGEFEPWTEEVERASLEGRPDSVAIVPTASAPEGDAVFDRWANMGLEHYAAFGVDACVVPLKTREDAERDEIAAAIADVGMIFFSGGNPRYLADTIDGTLFWYEMNAAFDRGTGFAGCSAGPMVQVTAPTADRRSGRPGSRVSASCRTARSASTGTGCGSSRACEAS